MALPAGVQRKLAGKPIVRDGLTLHHEPALLARLQDLTKPQALDELTVAQARRQVAIDAQIVAGGPVPLATVRDLTIAGGLRARLYVPSPSPLPLAAGLLVYFHGGGMVLGDLDSHDCLCRLLAFGAGARVLAVDYRLAPEHPFPAAYDDAWAAYEDAVRSLADAGPVAVGGDSAGGNLAAGVALRAASSGGDGPAFQLLIYPWLDMSRERPSYSLFSEGFYLSRRDMIWYRSHYLGDGADPADPRCSPMLAPAESLAGVAPAYIATAGFDPLRDEAEEYAERLRAAGVRVALRRHEGLVHGFANWQGVGRTGREAVHEAAGALRMALSG